MNANALIGTHDVLLLVLDSLRFDVADELHRAGRTPNLSRLIGADGWELRHAPGNFTFASHQAFFAGFLPTPARPGRHARLFATRFGGSETTGPGTAVFDEPDIVHGLAARGYRTVCIGGVGFFNPQSSLGRVLPGYFSEAHWSEETSTTAKDSMRAQVELATGRLAAIDARERVFLFINVPALHQPNRHYLAGATEDSRASHAAALEYVDSQLPPLFDAMRARADWLTVICSDHGTAYGEDGFFGHRLSHPVVWNVPYAERVIARTG